MPLSVKSSDQQLPLQTSYYRLVYWTMQWTVRFNAKKKLIVISNGALMSDLF